MLRQHELGDQESVHVLRAFVATSLEPVRSKHFVSSLVQGGRDDGGTMQGRLILMSASCCGFCILPYSPLPSEINSNVPCSHIGKFEDLGMSQLQETPGWCVPMGEPKYFVNGSVYNKSWGRPQSLCASSVLNRWAGRNRRACRAVSSVFKSFFCFSPVCPVCLALGNPGSVSSLHSS